MSERRTSSPRLALAVVATASLMVALDALVVSTALTTIKADLGASVEHLEWTVNAYNLVFAVLLMPAAGLGDRFGRRKMFAVGLGVFVVASAWCALSPSAESLIAGRAVQGSGAALVTTISFALVSAEFPPERRGSALGTLQGIVGVALIAGPLAGGVIAGTLTWQWIFWLNVPIGLVVLPLCLTQVRESFGPDTRLDMRGLVLVTCGALGVVWALVRANTAGWASREFVTMMGAGIGLLIGFVAWELRARAPMLSMRLFRSRAFTGGNVATFCLFTTIFTGLFFFAQFFQTVLGANPVEAGLRMLPWTGLLVVMGPLVGRVADRIGERPLLVGGLALVVVGFGWFALMAQPEVRYASLVLPMVVAAFGGCLALPAAATAVLRQLPEAELGKASGANGIFREMGGVFGLAVTVAVFARVGGYGTTTSFTDGMAAALAVAAGFALIGAVAGALVPSRAARTSHPVRSGRHESALSERPSAKSGA